MIVKRVTLVLVLSFTLAAAGCNTWSGFGQDLQKVGQKVQKQGDKVNQ